ncbi:MAG: protein-glutamate methylesterase/protein-glutamine glutaminase [Planctomycetota bacterium]
MAGPVRVLVVDDSALARRILKEGLAADPQIEVVGTASDPYQARDQLVVTKPDVMTLDVEMPRMDGVEFLRRLLPQWSIPVVMVSSLTERGGRLALDALAAGAVEVVTKPKSNVADGMNSMLDDLRRLVKAAAHAQVRPRFSLPVGRRQPVASAGAVLHGSTDKVIAIGASTGGTEAIASILKRLPGDMPGIVIVQHMPANFTRLFAERLDRECTLSIKEAKGGERIMRGHVLVAPGDRHMVVLRSGGQYRVQLHAEPPCCGHRPSVEVLFNSVARQVGSNAACLMLTGMGRDGAVAMRAVREAGGRCLAQDEASCVVYGMPKEAMAMGGAEKSVPLTRMPDELLRLLREMS